MVLTQTVASLTTYVTVVATTLWLTGQAELLSHAEFVWVVLDLWRATAAPTPLRRPSLPRQSRTRSHTLK